MQVIISLCILLVSAAVLTNAEDEARKWQLQIVLSRFFLWHSILLPFKSPEDYILKEIREMYSVFSDLD